MAASMKPRERVLAALHHQEPDRVPIDIGGATNTTLCIGAYESLARALAVQAEPRVVYVAQSLVEPPEALLRLLPVDTRPVFGKTPSQYQEKWLDDDTYVDQWGITFRRPEAHKGR